MKPDALKSDDEEMLETDPTSTSSSSVIDPTSTTSVHPTSSSRLPSRRPNPSSSATIKRKGS